MAYNTNNYNAKNSQDEQRRRPQFWSHPANYHHGRSAPAEAAEAYHEIYPPGTPESTTNNLVRRSMIPWSPGQLQAFRNYDGYTAMIDVHNEEEDGDGEEEEEACCKGWCFCRGCCLFRGCCRRRLPSPDLTNGTMEEPFHLRQNSVYRENDGGSYCCLQILLILISAATLGGLYYFTSRLTHHHWTMNCGESRRIAAGFLMDSVVVSQTSSNSHTEHSYDYYNKNNTNNETVSLGMAVYALGHNECPRLTGPPVTLDAPPEEVVLLHNAFEYQYFYLNKGSTMQVTVHQKKGATNILVLRGNKVLARIQEKKKKPIYTEYGQAVFNDLELDQTYSIDQVVMERVSWTGRNAPIQFSFTSPASDVYVLMYDNAASQEAAAFNVSYHLVLTTYNLEGLAPWCSHSSPVDPNSPSDESSVFTCPPLNAAEAGCIIVEATEKRGDNGHNTSSTVDRVYLVGEGGITVTVELTRQWVYMGAISLMPSVLVALTCCYRRRKKRRRFHRQRQRRDQADHYDPVPHRRRQQNEQEVAYQYLPSHHQQDATTSSGGGEQFEESQQNQESDTTLSRGHNRNLSTSSFSRRNNSNRLCSSEAETDGQHSTNAVIPASSVLVVVKDDTAITTIENS